MSSENTGGNRKLKKMLYVFRVIDLGNCARKEEVTSESFVIMELPRGGNRYQIHRWRTLTRSANQHHAEIHPSTQENKPGTKRNRDLNSDIHFSETAKHAISEELNFFYDYIAKPTDVHLIANEGRSGSFATDQMVAVKAEGLGINSLSSYNK